MEITKVRQLTASSGILIYPVIPLTYRFLNHPSSKLRRIGRPRTTLWGIYIIFEIIYRFSPSSIMIPSSRRSALGPPLRLQLRAAKLLEITEMGIGAITSQCSRPSVDFDGFPETRG